MLRWFIAILFSFSISAHAGTFSQVQLGGAASTGWFELKIGGGGNVNGMCFASDGTKVVRTDSNGEYLYFGGIWNQLVSTNSFPSGFNFFDVYNNGSGVYECAVAPSNTSHFYMVYDGYVFASTNKGINWTQTAFTQDISANSNDAFRSIQHKMAVDPINDNVVWMGTETALYYTQNGGASWTTVSIGSIPSPLPAYSGGANANGAYLIEFDASGGSSGGMTKNIFVSSYGNGLYESTNSGSTFSAVGSSPTTHLAMAADGSGNLYYLDNVGGASQYGNLWRLNSGSWTDIFNAASNSANPVGFTLDPSNLTHIFLGDAAANGGNGGIRWSLNSGSSWNGPTGTITISATDIPWLNGAPAGVAVLRFDPTVTTQLDFGTGLGFFYTPAPTGTCTSSCAGLTFTSNTVAIEQLVARWIVSPPAGVSGSPGYPILSAYDQPVWDVPNPNIYPSSHGVIGGFNVVQGSSGDWASSNPNYIFVIANNGACSTENSGYSTNGGATWSQFGSVTPCTTNSTRAGCIAASSPTNIVWLPTDAGSNNNGPWYTTNGAVSWSSASVPGNVPASGVTGWLGNYYNYGIYCAADRVTAGEFYLYNDGASGAGVQGIYKSTNNGATFTYVYSGTSLSGGRGNAQMRTVPGQAGNIFWTAGNSLAYPDTNSTFWFSQNAGTSWTQIAGVESALSFGFGKAATGHTYPAIYYIGWYDVSGTYTYGTWRCINFDGDSCSASADWTMIASGYPLGNFDPIDAVDGDNNIYGRIYVATRGAGWFYGQFN